MRLLFQAIVRDALEEINLRSIGKTRLPPLRTLGRSCPARAPSPDHGISRRVQCFTEPTVIRSNFVTCLSSRLECIEEAHR